MHTSFVPSPKPKNFDHIFNDHVSQDQFKQLCKTAWEIDLTSSKENGKYRINFDNFYSVELKQSEHEYRTS